ncbi:hypothetical protein B0H14DRAFT_2604667 [Mycena olivaceomarginata]|nr:hypothetical protein B0H14DRAFT_2604667 [Mycena olivaceomarginata]
MVEIFGVLSKKILEGNNLTLGAGLGLSVLIDFATQKLSSRGVIENATSSVTMASSYRQVRPFGPVEANNCLRRHLGNIIGIHKDNMTAMDVQHRDRGREKKSAKKARVERR